MKREEIPTPIAGHRKASAAVTAALGTLSFPITKNDAIRAVGEWHIPLDARTRVPLGDLLRGVPAESFGDVAAATAAVDKHWGRLARTVGAIERAERERDARARERR